MAHVFRIAEKSFSKRFYSCLLIPLALQILSIYFMSELLAFIFLIFIYLALIHLLFQLFWSYAMLRNGNVVFQNISLLFLMLAIVWSGFCCNLKRDAAILRHLGREHCKCGGQRQPHLAARLLHRTLELCIHPKIYHCLSHINRLLFCRISYW